MYVYVLFTSIISAVNSNTTTYPERIWLYPNPVVDVATSNISKDSDVSGFMKSTLATESGTNCGGYHVAMSICKIQDPG